MRRLHLSPAKESVEKVAGFRFRRRQDGSDATLGALESTDRLFQLSHLEGCVAAGDDREETIALMQDAIAFHLEGMAHEGFQAPSPQSESTYVEIGEHV